MDKKSYCIAWLMLLFVGSLHAQYRTTTYCNPLNLDYTYPFHNSHLGKSYRSGADPAVVEFRGEYYMFVTRSWGYWHSKDLLNWDFITPEKWYFEGCNAPAAHNYKDSVLYVCGNPSGAMSILYTDNPKRGDWKAVPSVLHDLQDPALFIDDDERAYMYWGSSNRWPIRGKELDMKNKFLPIAKKPDSLLFLRPDIHGWERFGENHTSDIKPFIEGAWMTKHNGKYYLQYAVPGTQFNVYGDGVYVGKSPLGPFQYAAHNPFCYKPGGFATGAGHGSTVCGPGGIYWHFGTIHLSINYKFERRLCMFPTFFDEDGVMYSDTYFGDYPHYSPDQVSRQTTSGGFRGWMLLSYGKPVKASSQLESYPVENVTDENLKTFWVADSYGKGTPGYDKVMATALRYFPASPSALNENAVNAISREEYAKAVELLEKSEVTARSAELLSTLGVAYAGAGQYDKAEDVFRRASEAGSATARHNLEEVRQVIDQL